MFVHSSPTSSAVEARLNCKTTFPASCLIVVGFDERGVKVRAADANAVAKIKVKMLNNANENIFDFILCCNLGITLVFKLFVC